MNEPIEMEPDAGDETPDDTRDPGHASGAIVALVLSLEADDQSVLHEAPWNSAANGPERKLCMADAEMFAAAGSVGSTPNVV